MHHFTPSVSSYALSFPFFKKKKKKKKKKTQNKTKQNRISRPISLRFWQNFSSKHTNWWKFVPRTLVYFFFSFLFSFEEKICSEDPTFENLCGTWVHPSKICLSRKFKDTCNYRHDLSHPNLRWVLPSREHTSCMVWFSDITISFTGWIRVLLLSSFSTSWSENKTKGYNEISCTCDEF